MTTPGTLAPASPTVTSTPSPAEPRLFITRRASSKVRLGISEVVPIMTITPLGTPEENEEKIKNLLINGSGKRASLSIRMTNTHTNVINKLPPLPNVPENSSPCSEQQDSKIATNAAQDTNPQHVTSPRGVEFVVDQSRLPRPAVSLTPRVDPPSNGNNRLENTASEEPPKNQKQPFPWCCFSAPSP